MGQGELQGGGLDGNAMLCAQRLDLLELGRDLLRDRPVLEVRAARQYA
jgi:hypothetical protein